MVFMVACHVYTFWIDDARKYGKANGDGNIFYQFDCHVRIQNDTSGHVKNYRVIFAVYRFFCPGTNIHARDNKADCDVVVTSNLLPIFLKFILKFFRHVYSFLFFFVLFIHFFFL